MNTSCDACLRHAYLIAHLAPRIAGMLDRPRERVPGVLRLDEQELIEQVAPRRADAARQFLEDFDWAGAGARLAEREVAAICGHH